MATTIQGYISDVTLPNSDQYPIRAAAIPYGEVDSTSTSTAYTATIPGIYSLVDGACVMLKNGVVTSASGFTININNLGAKPVYNSMATGHGSTDPTRDTTIFNINYTMLLVYSTDIVSGGGWICYRGYDDNTNTIGYQLRTNATVMNVTDTARYYKLYFMNADSTGWVPASINSTNDATTARSVNQRPINPFGRIVYTSASTNYTAGANLAAASIWDQYTLSLGYSFNNTGKALTMTAEKPVYLKCAPQTNGSAIMDASNPIVQSLPSSADGKIYIYLGVAYDTTHLELVVNHPVYYHDGSGIKIWGGSNIPTKTSQLTNDSGFITEADIPEGAAAYTGTPSAVSTTAAKGTSNAFARGDHVHNITGTTITNALGYTPYNSTNPNGYTNNTGTVTGITAGTGLKVGTNTSGGTISTSGTINHINSVTAKTTQGLYPITYDAQGHITGSGSAITVPTASSTTPLMDGTATVGSGTTWARADHVHPSDSSKVDAESSSSYDQAIISNENGVIDLYSEPQSGSAADKTGITIGSGHTTIYYGNDSYLGVTQSGFNASYVPPSGKQLTSYAGPVASGMAVYGESESDSWALFNLEFNNNTNEAQARLSVNGAVSSGESPENEIVVTPTTTTIKNVVTPVDNGDAVPKSYVDGQVATKQATLVSGTNIKTINGTSLLGSGNITTPDTDEKVQQTNTTSNVQYPVILANSANATTETAGVKKSLALVFDPSAKELIVDNNSNTSYMSSTGFASQVGENSVSLNPSELIFTDNSAYAYIGNQVTAGVYNWITTDKSEQTLHGIAFNTRLASQYKFSFETGENGIRLYKYARESNANGSIQEDNYVTNSVQMTASSIYLRTYTYNESTTGGSVNEVLHIKPTYIDIGTTSGGFSRITKNKIDTWDSYTDTKNTTGSTNTSSKIFLVGATSQAANPQTYSHDTAYVGTNGHLYSNSKQVVNLSDTQTLTNKTLTSPTINEPAVSDITTVAPASFWTENSTNTESVTAFQAYRWGNLISVRMNVKTSSTVTTSTTTTLGTVGANYKSATLVYANTRSHTAPYAPYTGGSVWITGDTISCRLPASTWVNLSLVYLINPNA